VAKTTVWFGCLKVTIVARWTVVRTKRSLRKCNSLLFSVMNWLFFSCTCLLDWGGGVWVVEVEWKAFQLWESCYFLFNKLSIIQKWRLGYTPFQPLWTAHCLTSLLFDQSTSLLPQTCSCDFLHWSGQTGRWPGCSLALLYVPPLLPTWCADLNGELE